MELEKSLVEKVLKSKLKSKDFELKTFDLQTASESAGLMGQHFKLITKVFVDNTLQTEYFFVKRQSDSFDIMGKVFKKESDAYELFKVMTNVVPLLKESLSECYFNSEEVLVFEDLCSIDFTQQDIHKLSTYEEMEMLLNSLSRIHASCIAYEEHMRKKIGRFVPLNELHPEPFREIYLDNEDPLINSYNMSIVKGVKYQIELYDLPRTLNNGDSFVEKAHVLLDIPKISAPSKVYRNVLCHCDLNHGNIFMKRRNGKPVDCKIIDYQITRFKPPANDVICALWTNTTRKFREIYQDQLLESYYNNFCKYLGELHIDAQEILTFSDFLKSFELEKPMACYYEIKTNCLVWLSKKDTDHFLTSPGMMDKTYNDSFAWLFKTYERSKMYDERCKDGIMDLFDTINQGFNY